MRHLRFAFLVFCCLVPVTLVGSVLAGGGDTGWLIATGKYICENRALPSHDIFTWTNSRAPFVCYQWLFEVGQYLLYKFGGLTLVGFASFCAAMILYLAVLPLWWQRLGLKSYLAYMFLAPVLTPFWLFARPQLVSYIFAAVTIFALEIWRAKPQSKIANVLPPLAVLWTNMHCFAALLPLLCFCYALCQREAGQTYRLKLAGIAVLCSIALFVTPFDVASVVTALNLFVHTDVNACNELKPLYLTSQLLSLCNVYTAVAFYLLIWRWRSIPLCGRLIGFGGLCAGLAVARLQPLAVILSWPYLGLALLDWIQPQKLQQPISQTLESQSSELQVARPEVKTAAKYVLGAIALSAVIWFYKYPDETAARNSFLGQDEALSLASRYPYSQERIFNDTIAGSRLILLRATNVYIDSRLFMFDKAFFDNWLSVMNAAPGCA